MGFDRDALWMSAGGSDGDGIPYGADLLKAGIWKGMAIVPVNKPSAYLFIVALSQ